MEKNYYCVYTLRLANFLDEKGFKVKKTCINYNNPNFKVFFFEDTEELRKVVNDYINNRKK